MLTRRIWSRTKEFLLASVILLSLAGTSSAAEFWLSARAFTKTMPDATAVRMWGFVETDSTFTPLPGEQPTVPGPILFVPPGDNTLIIHLKNDLTGEPFTEPISIVIPGQIAAMAPVKFLDSAGRQRVMSFTQETPVGGTNTYTWNNFKPGTYLYHSGSHPALQVQMGLYGPAIKDSATKQAYPGMNYFREVILFFSEIDPVVHGHVANGTYGTPPPAGITSTIDFHPKYFLINGNPFSVGLPPIPAGTPGLRTLVRFLNAGLRDYAPVLQGLYINIVAEDGNLLPFQKNQYSLFLPAGKTMDALLTPTAVGDFPVYDRRLNLTNGATSSGGMLTYLQFASTNPDTVGVFRPSTGDIFLKNTNSSGFADAHIIYGMPGDKPITGDWDGDGIKTIGIYRNGSFFLRNSNTSGFAEIIFPFGTSGDLPVAGDWDGDGIDTIGVYSNGTFFLRNSNSAGPAEMVFDLGIAGDVPISGDWTGKGFDTVGVFRPSTGQLFLKNTNATGFADIVLNYGLPGDKPVTGDWNGDGTDTIGVYRNNTFLLRNSNTPGFAELTFDLGLPGDVPIAGDWDGLP
jgi:FtsP/CotA-like multicopper oxidase with cupredoxin domain